MPPMRGTVRINSKALRRARRAKADPDTGKPMSQAKLAALSRVSRSYLSELELGKKQPNIRIALMIADALGVDLEQIVKG